MTIADFFNRPSPRSPWIVVGSYIGVLILLCVITLLPLLDVAARYGERNVSLDNLATLQKLLSSDRSDADNWPTESPLLEGESATIANAGLLQRITRTTTALGGSIVSSEVEPQRPQANDHFLKITVNLEIEQPALQQLLYDIESGMPFLFIDRINVQNQAIASEAGRLRVALKLSGLWLRK
jgi:general secretion pathway protein M